MSQSSTDSGLSDPADERQGASTKAELKDAELAALKASNEELRKIVTTALDLLQLQEEGKPQPTAFFKRVAKKALIESVIAAHKAVSGEPK